MGVIAMSDKEQKPYSQVSEVLYEKLSIVELSMLIEKYYHKQSASLKKLWH